MKIYTVTLFFLFLFLTGCDDLFLRFKYETFECENNQFNLKKIFVKNFSVGEFVDVEIDDLTHRFKIIENSENLMVIAEYNPTIIIKINKSTNELNARVKNHIYQLNCEKYMFRM